VLLSRLERRRGLNFNRLIPNILTLLALCAGLTAIRFALQGRWEAAVLAILVAAILDGLDGRIARILKGASKFGAELDSLSDFVCFGVTPALMLYLWSAHGLGRFGWLVALLYAICCALRLARFNTSLDQPEQPQWTSRFFTGVPAPMGAGLVLWPMLLDFQFAGDFFRSPYIVVVFMVAVAGLMVSKIPTFSFKRFRVPPQWILPTLLAVAMIAASLVTAPWLTLSVFAAIYLGSIPVSIRAHAKLKRELAPPAPAEAPVASP